MKQEHTWGERQQRCTAERGSWAQPRLCASLETDGLQLGRQDGVLELCAPGLPTSGKGQVLLKASSLAMHAMALSSTAASWHVVKGSRSCGEKSCRCAHSTGHWSFRSLPGCSGSGWLHPCPAAALPSFCCSPPIPLTPQGSASGRYPLPAAGPGGTSRGSPLHGLEPSLQIPALAQPDLQDVLQLHEDRGAGAAHQHLQQAVQGFHGLQGGQGSGRPSLLHPAGSRGASWVVMPGKRPQGPACEHLHVECSIPVLCVLVAREVEDAAEAGPQEAALPLLWKQPRSAARGERAEA